MSISKAKLQEIKNRYEIVGNSPLLNNAIEKALTVAPTDISVLVSGESGVGKEAFSKIIHANSKRKHGHFIAINCAAIPEGTIDSELFGHEKGAFTSAYDSRKGYFETVNGGTIFLDEISELPMETQSRLLRVLESGEFIKVGSSKVLKTDIRLVAASNKDLLQLTQDNKFREDLFYRLSTVSIKIPPLRKRTDDILYLVAKFANDFADKYKTTPIELNPEALDILKSQYWPGNIRQLKNVVEQISIFCTERTISADAIKEFLPEIPVKSLVKVEKPNPEKFDYQERDLLYKFLIDIKKDVTDTKGLLYEVLQGLKNQGNDFESTIEGATDRLLQAGSNFNQAEERFFNKQQNDLPPQIPQQQKEQPVFEEIQESLSLADKEKEMIEEALIRHRGKRKPAARDLGISERTLYRKIKDYQLEDQ